MKAGNFLPAVRRAVAVFKATMTRPLTLASMLDGRGWVTLWNSSNGLGWQSDTKMSTDNVLAFAPVYACITLIASDIGKLDLRLMRRSGGIWAEAGGSNESAVLRRPNHYQTRQQFIECWLLSKLLFGNAYILKLRHPSGVVRALYVLDPNRVQPLVAPDGTVYYKLQHDDLSKLPFDMPAVPAAEIIHDRKECLFHPLVGISPLFAATLSASQGLRIQRNSEEFFKNMSRPSGMLTAPENISDEVATRLKKHWEENFTGDKIGRIAVLGNGLKYEAMTINAVDAQLIEQLQWTLGDITRVFKIPQFKVGGAVPPNASVSSLNLIYYADCLQSLIEAAELCLDRGLELPEDSRTEFDLDDLLRMDSGAQADMVAKLVGAGVMSPNEARARFNLGPVRGGESPMIQQQNWSLAQLANRGSAPNGTQPGSDSMKDFAERFERLEQKTLMMEIRETVRRNRATFGDAST